MRLFIELRKNPVCHAPWCALLAMSLVAASCSPPLEANISSSPILDGEPAPDAHAVFALFMRTPEDEMGLCTATLIAPDLGLTARHCVADVFYPLTPCVTDPSGGGFGGISPYTFYATFDDRPGTSSSTFYVTPMLPNDGARVSTCDHDIALVRLSRPSELTPVPLDFVHAPTLDQRLEIVGYGGRSPDDDLSDWTRRRADASVIAVGPVYDGTAQLIGANEFVIESGACKGDSGGPALDSAGRLVGVASRAGTTCAPVAYVSLLPHAEWIRSEIQASYARTMRPIPDAGASATDAQVNMNNTDMGDADRADAGAETVAPPSSCTCRVVNHPYRIGRLTVGFSLFTALVWCRRRRRTLHS